MLVSVDYLHLIRNINTTNILFTNEKALYDGNGSGDAKPNDSAPRLELIPKCHLSGPTGDDFELNALDRPPLIVARPLQRPGINRE